MNQRKLVSALLFCSLLLSLAASTAAASTIHEVKRGDTLWLISQTYGRAVAEIQQANDLRTTMIYPGMKLTIPGDEQAGARAVPWSAADRLFPRNTRATILDVRTGLTFTAWRRGGWAHADVEPATRQDTDTLRRIYGGSWSWTRRPIVVIIGNHRIAASMNGMPHGRQSIYNNGFPGHHCIHFLHSTTHGTRRVDANHQNAVRQAVGH